MQPRPHLPWSSRRSLACWFCLLAAATSTSRVLPFPLSSLPLDDPNTDGVESAQSEVAPGASPDGSCCHRPSVQAASSPLACTPDRPLLRILLNSPLRCQASSRSPAAPRSP